MQVRRQYSKCLRYVPLFSHVISPVRSALSSDADFDRGDSCGSFEFLGRNHGHDRRPRRPSTLADDSIREETDDHDLDPEEENDEEKLFLPVKGANRDKEFPEEAEVLRQIQELSANMEASRSKSSSSRKSSSISNDSGGSKRSKSIGQGSDRSNKGDRKV